MPRMDGLEMIEELRAKGIRTPVILHTSLHDMMNQKFNSPVVRCVLKNGDLNVLEDALREALAIEAK